MGVVLKARDPAIERLVAIKVLRLDVLDSGADLAEANVRFHREARAIGQLAHPHIVTLFDAQREGDLAYLVMEYVPGQSLDALLRAGTVFSPDRVCAIGIEVCDALAHAHARDVIHRDIKPANILVQDNGQVKVTDFGVAYLTKSTLTRPGQSLGTPSYMSPEQIEGKSVGGSSDLFSLGAVLYELACRQKAFPGETITTVIYQILHTEPVPLSRLNPLVPPILDATIRRALAKDLALRYAMAREFWEALAQVAAIMASTATGKPAEGRDSQTPRLPAATLPPRRRVRLVGGTVAFLGMVLAALLWASRLSTPNLPTPKELGNAATTSPVATIPPASSLQEVPAMRAHPPTAAAASLPRAVRVTFARDVKGVLPVEEGDAFYRDDRKVILWVRWANVRGKHTTLTRWFNPDGEIVSVSPRPDVFESPAEWWTTWATLRLPSGKRVPPGEWRAEIELDGRVSVIAQFLFFDRPRPPLPIRPPASNP